MNTRILVDPKVFLLVILLSSLLLLPSQGVQGEKSYRLIDIIPGSDVVLDCDVASKNVELINWRLNNSKTAFFVKFMNFKPFIAEQFTGRLHIVNQSAIRISRVSNEDSGTYRCRTMMTSTSGGAGVFEQGKPIIVKVSSGISGPVRTIIRNVGQDAVFMWNSTNRLFSARCGLLNENFIFKAWLISANIFSKGKISRHPKYKGRVDFVGNLTAGHAWFKLSNLTLSDTGKYVFSLIIKGLPTIRVFTNLIVTVPPTFSTPLQKYYYIREGMSMDIDCSAIGLPTPNVTWFHDVNGTMVTKSRGVGSAMLNIPKITRRQSGMYECQAINNPNERPTSTKTDIVVLFLSKDTRTEDTKTINGSYKGVCEAEPNSCSPAIAICVTIILLLTALNVLQFLIIKKKKIWCQREAQSKNADKPTNENVREMERLIPTAERQLEQQQETRQSFDGNAENRTTRISDGHVSLSRGHSQELNASNGFDSTSEDQLDYEPFDPEPGLANTNEGATDTQGHAALDKKDPPTVYQQLSFGENPTTNTSKEDGHVPFSGEYSRVSIISARGANHEFEPVTGLEKNIEAKDRQIYAALGERDSPPVYQKLKTSKNDGQQDEPFDPEPGCVSNEEATDLQNYAELGERDPSTVYQTLSPETREETENKNQLLSNA